MARLYSAPRLGYARVVLVVLLACSSPDTPVEEDPWDFGGGQWTPGFTGLTWTREVSVDLTECDDERDLDVRVVLDATCLATPWPYAWGWPSGEFELQYTLEAGPPEETDDDDDCDGHSDGAEVSIEITGPDEEMRTSDARILEAGGEPATAGVYEETAWRDCVADEACEREWEAEIELEDGDAARVTLLAIATLRACSSGDPVDTSLEIVIE